MSAPLQFDLASILRFLPDGTPGMNFAIAWLRDLDKSDRLIETTCYKGLRFRGPLRGLSTFMTSRWTPPALAQIFDAFLEPGAVLADVGGFFGVYALWGARLVGSSGRVYTFEPSAESARFLRQQVDLNGFSWVEVVNSAVGEESGKVKLQLAADRYAGGITSRYLPQPGIGTIEAPLTTLDEFFRKRSPPKLIKIDVEGMEPEVLRGASGLLDRAGPAVVFESDCPALKRSGTPYQSLVGWLRERGYEVWSLTPRGLSIEPTDPQGPGSRNVLAAVPERHEPALSRLRTTAFPRNQNE